MRIRRLSFDAHIERGNLMNIIIRNSLRILGLVVIVGLTSCGGGGDGGGDESSASVSANGFWEGSFTEDGEGTFHVEGLLYNGRIIAVSESAGVVYDGSYTLSGNNLSGNLTVYRISGSVIGTATISGTVTEKSSISASFSTSVGSKGTISLSFNSLYNRDSSLSLIAGFWDSTIGAALTIVIENDGTFFGQDSDGCVLSGEISILDAEYNLYDVNLSVASCGVSNGSYDGFATLLTDNILEVVVSNKHYLVFNPLVRQ